MEDHDCVDKVWIWILSHLVLILFSSRLALRFMMMEGGVV